MLIRNVVALTFFRALKTFRLTFLRMRNKCKITLPRVNLRQITLLRGYIHPNEQPVTFIPHMLCLLAAH